MLSRRLLGVARYNVQTCLRPVLNRAPFSAGSGFKVGDKAPKVTESSVYVTFMDEDGHRFKVPGRVGQTLLETAKEHQVGIDGACDGALQCVSCHVLLSNESLAAYPPPGEEEKELLPDALGYCRNSRLACCLTLKASIPHTTVSLVEAAPTDVP